MKFFIVPLIVSLAAVATPVVAEPYVGFGAGSASYKANLTSLGGRQFDDNGTGVKLYGGYAFNKYYAAEADFYSFGESSVGALEVGPGTFASGAVSMKGIAAYAVGMYPLNKEFYLIAKLGVLNWDANLKVNNTTASNDGTDLAYALAASYSFTKELMIMAEWESFETDNPELSMFSIGFKFNFR